jgi:integrase
MPHVFSTLLRHHFGNSVASEVVESLKGQRRLPPPKQPGEILLEWDEIQSVREEVMAEIRSLQASADPDTKVVGRCSDLILMAILLTRPVRLRNLAAARLGTHLIRDTTGSWHFLVPQFEVKNAREIRLEIPPDLGCCLDTYFDIRARAGQPPESGPVFLNQRGTGCGPQTLRQRTRDLSKELWATRHSPQAFRSIMASAYVNEHPEDVTAVQCLLGHASPSTTFRYYILPDKATTRTRIRSWLEAHPALEKLRNLASTISGAAWCGNEPVKIVPPE